MQPFLHLINIIIFHVISHTYSLNPQNGQAIATNSTFESIFGPLYKFKDWEFANAATDEDVDPTSANTQGGDEASAAPKKETNRAKFRAAIDKVRASLSATSIATDNSGGGEEGKDKASATAKIRNIEMLTLGTNEGGLPIKHHFDWTIGSVSLENGDDVVILYGDMVNELESKDR